VNEDSAADKLLEMSPGPLIHLFKPDHPAGNFKQTTQT
jgi:hypothetical protein